ncbi:MAG TPA: nucleotidyl transferase AbiEii/AbiGii toxin family protein [Bacteroidales bacterium]|nr:nucleotidyl transferase AbiEii/AbiGii toxin family protein [Bacteroidales bacterium]
MLQTQAVSPNTLELLKKLQSLNELKKFRLVGGTALALLFGHRLSVDLDFFSYDTPLPEQFQAILRKEGIQIENVSLSNRINIFNLNEVKTDFVNYSYKWLKNPILEQEYTLASIEDIAAMKLSAITNRGTKKDFVDLFFLLEIFELKQMINLYHKKYPEATDFLLFKSLIYFEDAEKDPMPKMLKPIEWQQVKTRLTEIARIGF